MIAETWQPSKEVWVYYQKEKSPCNNSAPFCKKSQLNSWFWNLSFTFDFFLRAVHQMKMSQLSNEHLVSTKWLIRYELVNAKKYSNTSNSKFFSEECLDNRDSWEHREAGWGICLKWTCMWDHSQQKQNISISKFSHRKKRWCQVFVSSA